MMANEQVKSVLEPRNEGDHRPIKKLLEIENGELSSLKAHKPTPRKNKNVWNKDAHKDMNSSELGKN